MSILADSLGPAYPFGASPGLQQDGPMSFAAPLADKKADRPTTGQVRVPDQQPPTVDRLEALLPDHPADGPTDPLLGLVDFELFEQAMQSPEDDDPSRNNQAPADPDAHVLLFSYQQLLDAQTLAAAAPFHPVF